MMFVRYEPVPCFRKFTEKVATTHQKADNDKDGTAAGITAKLFGTLKYFLPDTIKISRYLIIFWFQETRYTVKPSPTKKNTPT